MIARRLARSFLLEPAPPGRLADVVAAVGLIQAQAKEAAELGLALRVEGATAADVRRELYERRSLVKTWALRSTLHLVPADEAPLWAAALRGPEPYWESREWRDRHGLSAREATRLFDAIADALDGACLTRVELAEEVERRLGRRIEKLRSGWGELLHPCALMGTLCFGPPRGGSVTFVRADQWLGGWTEHDPHAARREVLRRYLRAYGPAKRDDFRRWSGYGRDAARTLFAEAELEQVRVEGTRTWLLAGDRGGFGAERTSVHLLPRYDAYVLGFRPREPLLPPAVQERIAADPKGKFESVTGMQPLLVDGVVTGFWSSGEVEHVLPLPRGRARALRLAVKRVAEIVN